MEVSPNPNKEFIDIDTLAGKVGHNLSKSENLAFKAFSLSEDQSEKIKELAKDLGIKDGGKLSLEGLRLIAKRMLDKAQLAYETITNLFNARKRTQDSVINNIGR